MKSKNTYFYGSATDVERLMGEYEFLGLYAKKVPGGLMVPAFQPKAEKKKDGTWGWVLAKPRDERKRPAAKDERPSRSREQRPKERR